MLHHPKENERKNTGKKEKEKGSCVMKQLSKNRICFGRCIPRESSFLGWYIVHRASSKQDEYIYTQVEIKLLRTQLPSQHALITRPSPACSFLPATQSTDTYANPRSEVDSHIQQGKPAKWPATYAGNIPGRDLTDRGHQSDKVQMHSVENGAMVPPPAQPSLSSPPN